MYRIGRWLGYAIISDNPALQPYIPEVKKLLKSHYHGLVGVAEVLVPYGRTPDHLREAEEIIAQAEPLMAPRLLQKERAGWHYYVKGFLELQKGNKDAALAHFQHSAKLYPHKDNSAMGALETLARERRTRSQ